MLLNNEEEFKEVAALHLALFLKPRIWVKEEFIYLYNGLVNFPCEISFDKYPPFDWIEEMYLKNNKYVNGYRLILWFKTVIKDYELNLMTCTVKEALSYIKTEIYDKQ